MRTRELIFLFLLVDLLLVNISAFTMSFLYGGWGSTAFLPSNELIILLNASWFVTYIIYIDDFRNFKAGIQNVFKLNAQKFVVFIAIVSVCVVNFEAGKVELAVFYRSMVLFFLLKMSFSIWVYYYFEIKNQKNMKPMVIVGNNNVGNQLYHHFVKNPVLGFKPLGLLEDTQNQEDSKEENKNILGSIAEFQAIYNNSPFSDLIIALPLSDKERIRELILLSERNGVKPHIVPNYYGVINRTFKVQTVGDIPLLDIRSVPLDKYPNRFWKRAFDLFFASVMLVFLSPLMLLIAIAIKLESKGPVFYKPTRLGVNGEPFVLYKFRSMVDSDDANNGKKSTVLNDPRVTRLGKFLRKYNLDELPQLINVLNNEMSIVGPRPHRVHLNRILQEKMNNYMVRHFVKPGITGWAQVNGWRGPTETKVQYMGRTLHDLWYIENWSFWLDIFIIFQTAFGTKARKNAF